MKRGLFVVFALFAILTLARLWLTGGGSPAPGSVTGQQQMSVGGSIVKGISAAKPSTAATASESSQTNKPGGNVPPVEKKETEDERMSRLIVGNWETDRDGIRKLTVNDDGTAKMNVTLEGLIALTFGKQLSFNILWDIEDGMLNFETTGGEPANSVNLVVKMYGNKKSNPILELTDSRMLLKDEEEGEPDHDWKRVD